MVLEIHMKLCVTEPDFPENFVYPQNRENGQKRGQKRFFEFIENFLNFTINLYWIRSITKTCIFCSVPAQIPFLRKFWFLRYGPKCSQPIRLQEFLINHISRTNQWNSLIFYMLIQVHINQKLIKFFFGWAWSKMSLDSLVTGL